jgi:hypothetical protein
MHDSSDGQLVRNATDCRTDPTPSSAKSTTKSTLTRDRDDHAGIATLITVIPAPTDCTVAVVVTILTERRPDTRSTTTTTAYADRTEPELISTDGRSFRKRRNTDPALAHTTGVNNPSDPNLSHTNVSPT